MKNKYLWITILIVSLVLGGYKGISHATEVEDAKEDKTTLEDKKADIKNKMAKLEKEKDNVIIYIEKLDKQLNELTTEIENLETEIVTVQKELKVTEKELKKAKETEEKQYVTMKKRIKYMYENGNEDYLMVILSAKDVSDLLNRTEYISKISEYDQSILDRYQVVKQQVVDKEAQLETKLGQLTAFTEVLVFEQDTVTGLVKSKTEELEKYDKNIDKSTALVKKYNVKIQEQEALIEELLAAERKKAEENDVYDKNTTTKFRWPLKVSGTITSTFGYRSQPTAGASTYHKGIDIGVPTGTPIVAIADGNVVTSSYQAAAGNYVMIYHGNTTYSVYMHCSKLLVSVGDTVKKGEVIAEVGSTGVSTGPHLHFGISINDTYVNPLNYVSN